MVVAPCHHIAHARYIHLHLFIAHATIQANGDKVTKLLNESRLLKKQLDEQKSESETLKKQIGDVASSEKK